MGYPSYCDCCFLLTFLYCLFDRRLKMSRTVAQEEKKRDDSNQRREFVQKRLEEIRLIHQYVDVFFMLYSSFELEKITKNQQTSYEKYISETKNSARDISKRNKNIKKELDKARIVQDGEERFDYNILWESMKNDYWKNQKENMDVIIFLSKIFFGDNKEIKDIIKTMKRKYSDEIIIIRACLGVREHLSVV